jgi:Zn-dependent peptidase ImmA (M78 family)
MDEADVRQKARAFVANVDVSNIREDLSPYVTAANAKVKKDELGEGESGYTVTKPNGKHIITVNSIETDERQRFTVCHEIAHIVLGLDSSHEEVPSWSYAKRHPNEIACDTFAAELLMPYQQWLSAAPKEEPSPELIQHMADYVRHIIPSSGVKVRQSQRYALRIRHHGARRSAVCRTLHGVAASRSMDISQVGDPSRAPWLTESAPQEIVLRRRGRFHRTSGSTTGKRGLISGNFQGITQRTDTTISLLWFDSDDLPRWR